MKQIIVGPPLRNDMTNAVSAKSKRVATRAIAGISAVLLAGLASAVSIDAATRYVNVSNAGPSAPYTTWATAANVIQDAIDVAQPGDEIVVTNGVYESGGRVVHGALTNRVAVTKPLILRSLNGPDVTVIRGYRVPGTTNGDAAVRCVYLTNGAALVGFTLTGGATRTNAPNTPVTSGGGLWCESSGATVANCILSNNTAYFKGGGAYGGILNNCRLLNNRAAGSPEFAPDFGPGTAAGGGACEAELNGCFLSNNMADFGGGASLSTLNRCTILGNQATTHGGGVGGEILRTGRVSGTLNDCLVVSNVAGWSGGGADGAVMNNCVTARNTAVDFGGGVFSGTFNNCLIFANQAWVGGGVFSGDLKNCTVTGNSASVAGGGVAAGQVGSDPQVRLNNCIVYSNAAPTGSNWTSWTSFTSVAVAFDNSCTTPLPTNGVGNITNAPLFVDPAADDFRLQVNSPCIDAGANAYAPGGPDLDGNPRIVGETVDMGAYEFQGTIRYVNVNNTNPIPPYTTWASAAIIIQDAVDIAQPGDQIVVTNGVYESGGRAVHGTLPNRVAVTKPLALRSVNGPDTTVIRGLQIFGQTNGPGAVRCVYLTNGASLVGFTLTGGATHTDLDDNFVSAGGGVWCESGAARLSNCIVIGNAASMQAGGAYRGVLNDCQVLNNHASGNIGENGAGGVAEAELNNCVIGNNAANYTAGVALSTLNRCTIIGNRAWGGGGGVGACTLNDCLVVSNATLLGGAGGAHSSDMRNCVIAYNRAPDGEGGGAWAGTLDNCAVFANHAAVGGGVAHAKLNNCTVAGNSAVSAGGGVSGDLGTGGYVPQCVVNNSIVYSNSAPAGANWSRVGVSFTSSCTVPLPANGVGNITNAPLFANMAGGNLALQSNSPCINAGLNTYAPARPDLAGNPRVVGGTVDMGAYEFQSPQSMISHAWLQQFGLPMNGSMDVADGDHDGLNTLQEWRAGTNPTNSLSVLRLLTPIITASGVQVRWQSVANRRYSLERSSTAGGQGAFAPLAADIAGQPNTTVYNDTSPGGSAALLYRVVVKE